MDNISENNLVLVERTTWFSKRVVPMSFRFDVVKGNSLYKTIIEESCVDMYIEKYTNQPITDYGYTEFYLNELKAEQKKLKELIKKSNIKITINIELKNYE